MRFDTTFVAPFLAPLSQPIMLHLANQEKGEVPFVTTSLHEHLTSTTQHFLARWSLLAQQVEEKRERAYSIMTPIVEQNLLSTEWVIETFTEYTPKKHPAKGKALTPQTLSRWREQGLLRYQHKNQPDADNAAALLTARLIDPRERGWLPSTVAHDEPLWWCWRQDSPTHPVVPCPVPLPTDLPESALLWTHWRGAAWKPTWLPLGQGGAARWGGTLTDHGNVLWSITETDLEAWDAEIVPLGRNVLDKAARFTRHTLATLALLRLATPRLEQKTLL